MTTPTPEPTAPSDRNRLFDLCEFVVEAGQPVASAEGARNGPLEGMALREAWLKAIEFFGLTEEEALKAGRGAWKRGLTAIRHEAELRAALTAALTPEAKTGNGHD